MNHAGRVLMHLSQLTKACIPLIYHSPVCLSAHTNEADAVDIRIVSSLSWFSHGGGYLRGMTKKFSNVSIFIKWRPYACFVIFSFKVLFSEQKNCCFCHYRRHVCKFFFPTIYRVWFDVFNYQIALLSISNIAKCYSVKSKDSKLKKFDMNSDNKLSKIYNHDFNSWIPWNPTSNISQYNIWIPRSQLTDFDFLNICLFIIIAIPYTHLILI